LEFQVRLQDVPIALRLFEQIVLQLVPFMEVM